MSAVPKGPKKQKKGSEAPGIKRQQQPLTGATAGILALRRLQAVVPISGAFGTLGFALVAWSFAWAAARLLRTHPYAASLFAGIFCLLIAAMARREGLLSFLPQDLQDFLTKTTLYDLWSDDVAVQNFLRRWGRIQLLCQERSETEVAAIIRGLDPAFVDSVMTGSIVELLPAPVSQALLPVADETTKMNSTVAATGKSTAATSSRSTSGDKEFISSSGIAALLREKAKEKAARLTEPELIPAVMGIMAAGFTDAWESLTLLGARTLAVSAVACGGSAALLAFRSPQSLLPGWLRGEVHSTRLASMAAAIGAISAGASIALAALSRRYQWLREAEDLKRRVSKPADEPEREESPESSEVSPGE